MTFSETEIREIVQRQIEAEEQLGAQAGGSGHLGHCGYTVDEVKTRRLADGQLQVIYRYTLFVETEFTCYPDNPPQEYPRQKTVVLDRNGQVIPES